jgi:hypothetical protein
MPDHVIQRSISRTTPAQLAQSTASPELIASSWRTQISNWWNNNSVSIASYSQLPQQSELVDNQSDWESDEYSTMEALRLSKARWRTYWLAAVLCCGGALFGYDSGVIGMYRSSDCSINPVLTKSRWRPHVQVLPRLLPIHSCPKNPC